MTTHTNPPLFEEVEPPQKLFSAILMRVRLARQRAARLRFAAWGSVGLLSALMLVPAVQYSISEFYASGFYEYASLFLGGLASGYSKELLYSLGDSLPSFAILLLAATSIALVWSIQHARHDARLAFARVALPA